MAESPETSSMEKSLIGVKSEPPKDSKKKRKRSKKFSRSKFSEEMDTKSQESLTGDSENKENSEENAADREETIKEIEQSLTSVEEELEAKENKMIEGEAIKQDPETTGELIKKDSTQDSNAFEESGELKEEGKADGASSNQQIQNKKSKRPSLKFLRPSKKTAKGKLSSGGTKRVEGQAENTAENNDAKGKAMANDYSEEQEEIQDETNFEQDATREDTESKDEENSLEGTLERSHGKSNKEKKLKKFASFGRSKKKPESAINKPKEVEIADTETSELEKEEETSDTKSGQNIESESNEPATLDTNESVNEPLDKEKEEGEDKETGHVKRKASLLGFKRNKQSKKRRSLKNGEQMAAEADQSEIAAIKTDNAASKEKEQLKEAGYENAEKNNEENKDDKDEEKPANLQVKETMEGSTKEETDEWEEKPEQENEELKRGSLSRNRRSRILRSFKKLRSPRKKMQENEKSVNEGDGTTKTGQLDEDENSEFTQSTDGQQSDRNNSEECSPKAVKRKTSDLKNMDVVQAMKKKKEDDADDENHDQIRNEESTAEKNDIESKVEDKETKLKDELQNEAETPDGTHENMKIVMKEFVDFMEKRGEEIPDEGEEEEEEDESYDSDLTIVSEITVLSSAYELAGDQKSPLYSKRKEFRGTFVRESVNTNRLQLVEAELKDDPQTEHEGKYEESEDLTETSTEDSKESSVKHKSEVAEPEIQPDSERSVPENDKRDSNELEDTITVINQEIEVFSTPDPEPPAEHTAQRNNEELPKTGTKDTDESSEADLSQNLGSKQNGKAETQIEDSYSDSKSSGEIITQVDDTDQDKKKTGKDSFSSHPKAWILVQHLEMNEDISRQLGHMLSINAFKRTTSCCTIV